MTKLGKGHDATIVEKPFTYKKVASSEVNETTEYEVFKFDPKNRMISETKVHAFMQLFKNGNFFMKEFPAIVSEDFVILDGQHRFDAVRRLGLPFYFRFTFDLTIDNVVTVQANAGWSNMDFLNAYIKQENQNYIIMYRFIKRYNISVSLAAMLLSGVSRDSLGSLGFYDGSFRVKDEEDAHNKAQAIQQIISLRDVLGKDVKFYRAMIIVLTHPEYDQKRMIEQVEKYGSLLIRQVTIESYIRNIEEVFSYKLFQKNKVRFI